MSATNQRNLFIDTEQYHGSDNKARLIFPSQTLIVPQGFGMKLSLQQFTMKKTFYNINDYNNKFYLYNKTNSTYTEVTLQKGDFFAFGTDATLATGMCKNIQDALNLISGFTCTVTYNHTFRKFSIQSSQLTSNYYIVFFQIPPSRQLAIPANVSPNGYFSDTAEIFGGIATQQDPSGSHPLEGMSLTGTTAISHYPASLFSMESLRVLINLGNSNLETPNMDANAETSVCLTSQTFATIPIHTGTFDGTNLVQPAMIMFQDDGDELFSIKLQQNHIDNCTFSLVDNKGRPLNETAPSQYKNGQLSYQMVIRFEIIEEPFVSNPSNLPSSNRTGNLLPSLK